MLDFHTDVLSQKEAYLKYIRYERFGHGSEELFNNSCDVIHLGILNVGSSMVLKVLLCNKR